MLTGKSPAWGGALVRREATGYGAAYFVDEMLKARGQGFEGKTCVVSGSGNVAIYTIEKIRQLGGRIVACSDSDGVIYHRCGIDLPTLRGPNRVEPDGLNLRGPGQFCQMPLSRAYCNSWLRTND